MKLLKVCSPDKIYNHLYWVWWTYFIKSTWFMYICIPFWKFNSTFIWIFRHFFARPLSHTLPGAQYQFRRRQLHHLILDQSLLQERRWGAWWACRHVPLPHPRRQSFAHRGPSLAMPWSWFRGSGFQAWANHLIAPTCALTTSVDGRWLVADDRRSASYD